ncbi:hypothetical protein BGZ63DRAFT_400019 [Mariannaea sp. PMI_226]|nr:hypothetical protein BGZ63DRAFT_400019 [Mariannaea sp. PMI_226]
MAEHGRESKSVSVAERGGWKGEILRVWVRVDSRRWTDFQQRRLSQSFGKEQRQVKRDANATGAGRWNDEYVQRGAHEREEEKQRRIGVRRPSRNLGGRSWRAKKGVTADGLQPGTRGGDAERTGVRRMGEGDGDDNENDEKGRKEGKCKGKGKEEKKRKNEKRTDWLRLEGGDRKQSGRRKQASKQSCRKPRRYVCADHNEAPSGLWHWHWHTKQGEAAEKVQVQVQVQAQALHLAQRTEIVGALLGRVRSSLCAVRSEWDSLVFARVGGPHLQSSLSRTASAGATIAAGLELGFRNVWKSVQIVKGEGGKHIKEGTRMRRGKEEKEKGAIAPSSCFYVEPQPRSTTALHGIQMQDTVQAREMKK